jgi:hypothetical protein
MEPDRIRFLGDARVSGFRYVNGQTFHRDSDENFESQMIMCKLFSPIWHNFNKPVVICIYPIKWKSGKLCLEIIQ